MADMNLEGLDSIFTKIENLGAKGKNVENKALKEAATIINNEIKSNAPVSTSPRKPSPKTQMWRSGMHARNLLKISEVKSKDNQKFVLAGLQKDDNSKAFYLKFYEFGSSKTPATHFMSKAYESKKEEAKQAIIKNLQNALGLK